MNTHLFTSIGLLVVATLVMLYCWLSDRKIVELEQTIRGYQEGMDFLAQRASESSDRASFAEAKDRVYGSFFGSDPLYYSRAARRNETLGIGTNKNPTVAVDLDGVILRQDAWRGPLYFGAPVPGVSDGLAQLRAMGYEIMVYTTRVNPLATGGMGFTAPEQVDLVAGVLKAWHIPFDYISIFKPLADFYIDDRAIRFDSWGQTISDIESILKYGEPPSVLDKKALPAKKKRG